MGWNDAPPTKSELKPVSQKNKSWDSEPPSQDELSSNDKGFFGNAIDTVIQAGRFVDSYTGAPSRAFIGAIQENKNPVEAFKNQIGENPDLAPDQNTLSAKFGFPDAPVTDPGMTDWRTGIYTPGRKGNTMQESAGIAIGVGSDWTNIIPAVGALKGVAKGAVEGTQAAAKMVGRGAQLAAKATIPEKIYQSAANTAKASKEALSSIFKPTQAGDFKEFLAIAQKNGIDPSILPESVEFGPNSVISRGSRALREGPTGQLDAEKFTDSFIKIQEAAEKRIQKISGGVPMTEVEAGNTIRQGYDDAVERLFNDVDFTYNEVIKQVPGITLSNNSQVRLSSKLAGMEKWAKGRVTRGITQTERGQADQVLRAIEAVRSGNGSLKQTYEAMGEIGRHAFKTGQNSLADVPVDIQKFRDLYFTLRDEFIETTAERLGPDIAQKLIDSNQLISNFSGDKNKLAKFIGNKDIAPEKLFLSLVKNGDTDKINALKNILSPEQFNQLKGSLLETLVKRNPDGTIAFGNLYSAMQNKKNVLAEMFEPQEIAEFAEVVKLGNRVGPMVLSTSGTGGSNIFRNMLEGIESGIANRSTLDYMKNSARGRAAPLSPEKIVSPTKYREMMSKRTGTDNTAKMLQILAAPSLNGEQESALQRRQKEVVRKKLGQ